MKDDKPPASQLASISHGLALGSAIGLQAGCLGVLIVIGALLLGQRLDEVLGVRPWLTLGLLLVSAPLSVYAIYRFALRAAHRARSRERSSQEDQSPL